MSPKVEKIHNFLDTPLSFFNLGKIWNLMTPRPPPSDLIREKFQIGKFFYFGSPLLENKNLKLLKNQFKIKAFQVNIYIWGKMKIWTSPQYKNVSILNCGLFYFWRWSPLLEFFFEGFLKTTMLWFFYLLMNYDILRISE